MSDAALLVVLPGLDGKGRLSAAFGSHLPAAIRAVRPELPPTGCLDAGWRADWIGATVAGCENVFLLGQSYSTPAALTVARTTPSIRGLILVTPLSHRRARPGLGAVLRLVPELALRRPPPGFAIRAMLLGRDAPTGLIDAFRSSVRGIAPWVLAARLRHLAGLLDAPMAGDFPCPTLCLHAGQDRFLTGRRPADGQEAGGNGHHLTIPGPHLLLARHPREVAGHVARFIAEVSGR